MSVHVFTVGCQMLVGILFPIFGASAIVLGLEDLACTFIMGKY